MCNKEEMMIDMQQWNREPIKSRDTLGRNLTGQLDAEYEEGVEDDSNNPSLGDWIDSDDNRSEIGNKGRIGS